MRIEKFASEIFCLATGMFMLHRERIHGVVRDAPVKMAWDQAFRGCLRRQKADFLPGGALTAPDKELVRE